MSEYCAPIYDVRVIHLTKFSSDQARISRLNDKGDMFLCLGHFDLLSVRKIDVDKLPLAAIQKDIAEENTPTSYAYPLYILRQIDNSDAAEAVKIRTALDEFWSKESNFLLVSRFHCDEVSGVSKPFCEELMSRASEFPCERGSGDSADCDNTIMHIHCSGQKKDADIKIAETTASVVFYDSLELGDIVGVIKCNSLVSSLQVLQYLCGCKVVSDVYTYCGINHDLLKSDGFKGLSEERKNALENTSITYATTRFTVKHAVSAQRILDELNISNERVDFVTGTADLIVNWTPCAEGELVRSIGAMARLQNLLVAFSDIVTRVGIVYESSSGSRQTDILKRIPAEDLPRIETYSGCFNGRLEKWLYPVSRMLSTLTAMYESSVMDALSMLLIPGVNAFLSRVKYIQEKKEWKDSYERDISDFIDWWAALVNDISHLESQIVQHPELTPARYYIPVMVLQFEREFAEEYVRIMERLDKKASKEQPVPEPRSFVPVLFPTSEENVYTLCPLDPEFDTSYNQDSPLCIFLPVRRIFQPWALAHMLGHEIQHYSGDNLRCRDKRIKCIARSAASYLVDVLSSRVVARHCFQEDTITEELIFQDSIADLILLKLKAEAETFYLQSIIEHLPEIMFEIFAKSRNQESMQDILLKVKELPEQLENVRCLCQLNTLEMGAALSNSFRRHTKYLCSLYKECYADVSMILMLDCSFEDYYSSMFQEEDRNSIECMIAEKESNQISEREKTIFRQVIERHTDRLAMVILAIESCDIGWINKDNSNREDLLLEVALNKVDQWKEVRDKRGSSEYEWFRYAKQKDDDWQYSNILLADEAMELETYLCECVKQMKEILALEDPDISNLRKRLSYVCDATFNWNKLRNCLGTI